MATDVKAELTRIVRERCGYPPTLAATVFVEEEQNSAGYKLWVGDGYYEVAYECLDRAIERMDISHLGRFNPGPQL